MKCPKCKKEITQDPAGTFMWHCGNCKYLWANSEIKAYWKGFDDGKNETNKSLQPTQTPENENKILRRLLWLNHGHSKSLYGDDGEMQCGECLSEYGFWDWKRTPANEIEEKITAARIRKMANKPPDADTKKSYSGNPDNNSRKDVDVFHAPNAVIFWCRSAKSLFCKYFCNQRF